MTFLSNVSKPVNGTTTFLPLVMLISALVALYRMPADAAGFGYVPLVHLPPPPAPALTAVAGSTIPPHSDYVRITYVSAGGETTASAESVFSASADTLTVVHSPPIEAGAVGYNVYAIQNSGGSGTGHVLQNATPIAIGTDYTEPVAAWNRATKPPPTVNGASIPMPETVLPLNSAGGYVEAPVVNGAQAALDLPSNDAPPATAISLTSASGSLDRVVPPEPPVYETDKSVVLQTVGFAFSNNVTFDGLPTFKLTLPRGETAPAPYLVRIYDPTSRTIIATMPAFTYDHLAFLSDYTTPFHMLAFQRYYAELIARSPFAQSGIVSAAATTLSFPATAGIALSAALPSAVITPGSAYGIFASGIPPVGLPAITGTDVKRALYYASVTVTGTAAYSAPVTVTVTLPPSLAHHGEFKLAAYDSQFSREGWAVRVAPTRSEGRVLTFTVTMPPVIGWRQYGVALYASNNLEPTAADTTVPSPAVRHGHPPLVVVLGDSLSLLTIIPPSGVGCVPGWAPLPYCQYSKDPSRNWPGAFARLTGDEVINLSAQGTQTTVNSYAGSSMLVMMVPQIPVDAQVVVCQCGVNDITINGQSPLTSSRAAVITKAIHERAPRARIVYVGIRCFNGCSQPALDAWNGADKALAAEYGAFVDLIPLAPAGASAAFPDGSHPSPDTAMKIAAKMAEAIAALHVGSH